MSERADAIVDVTADLHAAGHLTGDDFNPRDRVFRCGDELVKVKTEYVDHSLPLPMDVAGRPAAHIVRVFHFSGSEVGEDGKAKLTADGAPRIWAMGDHLTVHPYEPSDWKALVADKQRICAWWTIVAARNAAEADELPGVAARALPAALAVAQLVEPAVALAAIEPAAAPVTVDVDVDPALLTEPAEDPAPAAAPRHPSGRRYLVHPGMVVRGHAAVFVTAAEIAEANGLSPAQYIVFQPDRPATYYDGLTPLYPAA